MIRALTVLAVLVFGPATAGEWPAYGGDQGGKKFSTAAEITPDNVDRLTRVWSYRTGHAGESQALLRRSKFQATPILVNDRLILCTPFNVVIALDPATGTELWRRDSQTNKQERPGNGFNCRGVAYWRDSAPEALICAERIFAATNDRRIVALDVVTGEKCETFGMKGEAVVEPGVGMAWPGEFQISSAPVVAGDVVIIGSAISDNVSVAAPKGTVHAFDARTGALLWAWDPVPRDDTAHSLGWLGDGPPIEGHANVWAPMSVDEARGLVFLPTSSPSPDFFGGLRPGDNRHANSVVALEAATGSLRWSFQTVHHDVWDYDTPAQPLLARVPVGGELRDAVIQATKMGLVFTLDRDTGEPLIPVEERPVPQGGVREERLSPTQPFPLFPPPLAPTSIKPEEAYGLTPFDRGACARAIASARHEGLYTPPSIQGTILYPFTGGGANWGGGAYDPTTNRLYLNTSSAMHLIKLIPREETDEEWHSVPNGEQAPMRGAPYAMSRQTMLSPLGLPCNPPPWGQLHAIDMGRGKIVWHRFSARRRISPRSASPSEPARRMSAGRS